MKIWLGNCFPEELGHLVDLLDNEFVIGKGYQLSLAKRFPHVLNPKNLSNIYLIKDKEKILSSVIVKYFDWIARDIKWKCAMIGMVYTIPEARGQDFATNLLKYVQEELLKKEVDFAVLFTTIPEFYLRLGWLQRDIGVLGFIAQEERNFSKDQYNDAPIPITKEEIELVELIRAQLCQWFIPRNVQDYLTIPRPSEYVKLLFRNNKKMGYAFLGGIESTAYIYEMYGTDETLKQIWNSIISQYNTIYVNDYNGSPSLEWLMKNVNIPWKMQQMTMWLYLSSKSLYLKEQNLPTYIPYFDRI